MTAQLDDTFAAGLRAALVEHVNTANQATSHHKRLRVGLIAAVGLTAVGGGVAVAAQLRPLPGTDAVHPLAPAVVVTGTGTRTVPLGGRPAGATRIELTLTCLTPGTFTFADGASETCTAADARTTTGTAGYELPLAAGQDTTTITAAPGSRWRLITAYATATTTAWGINTHGQTYGVTNAHGTPDLIAVIATNGRTGYAYAAQLQQADPVPRSPADPAHQTPAPVTVAVYDADGRTRIGDFVIG